MISSTPLFFCGTLRDLLKLRFPILPNNGEYIRAGIEWICSAQDSSEDGGVARDFSLKNGWNASYPETTGYIIPTMFDYYQRTADENIRQRAIRMADWLVEIQLPGGGIQAGTIAQKEKVPTIFNTGQVLTGWIRAYEETLDNIYLNAIVRAADWLTSQIDEDGAWRKAKSICTYYAINVYNTRVAWAMLLAWKVTGREIYKKTCLKNVKWAIAQQNSRGWFNNNCLSDRSNPLTHTIAYSTRGILEAGLCLMEDEMIDAAQKTAEALMKQQRTDGSLFGRYDKNWSPAVSWSCLTGNAQIAVIWFKLYQWSKDERYFISAKKALDFIKSMVNIRCRNYCIRGGVKGSYPIWSPYGKYQYLNWATKFFIDALMLETSYIYGKKI